MTSTLAAASRIIGNCEVGALQSVLLVIMIFHCWQKNPLKCDIFIAILNTNKSNASFRLCYKSIAIAWKFVHLGYDRGIFILWGVFSLVIRVTSTSPESHYWFTWASLGSRILIQFRVGNNALLGKPPFKICNRIFKTR